MEESFLFLFLSYALTPTLSQRERALPKNSWHPAHEPLLARAPSGKYNVAIWRKCLEREKPRRLKRPDD